MSINTQQQEAEIEADDLLTEIMLRLPSYSIHRFKLSCKQWHSLTTSSEFRKRWRKRNFKPADLILQQHFTYHRAVCRVFLPFSFNISKPIPSDFEIEQSCNGLLLCRSDSGYHVYNPTTTKYRTLPTLVGTSRTNPCWNMLLAYDPTRSPYYKVITSTSIIPKGSSNLIRIHIYSSDTHCWTSILKPRPHGFLDHGTYWNGSIHWIEDLLYFNIEDQTLKPMPAPPDPTWRGCSKLWESCGRLNCVTVGSSTPCFSNVYELKRDYSHWVLKYHVSIENCYYTVLSVVHGLEEDDSFLILKITDKIVRFNLVSKTSEELHDLGHWNRPSYIYAFQYVESLCDV